MSADGLRPPSISSAPWWGPGSAWRSARESHDPYDRLAAGLYVGDELVNADLAAQGLGRPMQPQPGDRFHDQVAAAWSGPAAGLTDSCDIEAGQRRQRTAATALDQNRERGLDEHMRQAAQTTWRAYEEARSADLARAVDALVPSDVSVVPTADGLLDDPATAFVADFDDELIIAKQVQGAEDRHDELLASVRRLRGALLEPSSQSEVGFGDERWDDIPAAERARVAAELRGLTEQSEEAVKEARSTLRQYRKLAAKAKAKAEAKAKAKAKAKQAKARAKAKARAAAAALAHPVRVGTYNICKSTCGTGRHSWGKRRKALVKEVRWADPDVLAVQEANTAKWHGTRQIDDVRRLLRPAGYEIASTRLTCTKGCTRGAHIFFKPTRMSPSRLPNEDMAAAGMTSLATIAHKDFGHIQDRAVSWAFLTPRGSSRPTLYVSVHMVTEKTKLGERLRVATARRMRSFTKRLVARSGLKDVPIVVAGDFNSYARRQPHGAQAIMTSSGFHDGYSAPVKENAHVGTVNHSPKIAKYQGFPPRPPRYQGSPTRIDYVFSTVAPLRHEVVVRLTKSGRFDDRYRASDHNMVMVDVPVR